MIAALENGHLSSGDTEEKREQQMIPFNENPSPAHLTLPVLKKLIE